MIARCVWCGRAHDTPQQLCPECDDKAKQLNEAKGGRPSDRPPFFLFP